LHLISGPLGTLVGLYETAIDRLATWEVDGKPVRPKVIASTATIRRAPDQVHALFVRRVRVFPPHGLDVEDNFFSRQRPIGDASPGRRYIGICAPGRRLKATLIRVYVAFLGAAQQLYDKYGRAVDPWMTLVGYFNAMRELGGMRRLVDDDVRTRLMRADQRGLAIRSLTYDSVDELTSRKGGTDIPDVLDSLEAVFDPAVKGKPGRKPLDVLLATNMLSVGVDVRRLGLMVVAGQPKTTAEYIQATSRVGRAWPGLVCTVLNWVRPRDLSHYERFEHYHATFYKHVEALSVTPFSPRAIDRGLTALLVSCIRLMGMEFNVNPKAGRIDRQHPYVRAAVEEIARRAHLVGAGAAIEQLVRAELEKRLDEWLARAQQMTGGQRLGYRDVRDGITVPLLRRAGRDPWTDFTCLNSLRDVEPEVGLVLDDRGLDDETASVPVAPPDANTETTP
ncbi:MAG: helicase-related protein, partial [Candidatus Rokuibacteriota bacterium]